MADETISLLISLLLFSTLLGGPICIILGFLRSSARWFFLAAFLFWIASFLAAFSVGGYILVLTFITLALGVAQSLGWMRSPWQVLITTVVGVVLWAIVLRWFWGPWIFWPMLFLFD